MARQLRELMHESREILWFDESESDATSILEVENLLESYEESLAANLDPKHREQAIASLAWNIEDSELKSEVAARAFRDDPEPRVRGVAIMALGGSAKPEVFRESFQLALKDPAFRRSHLSGALSNYASRNDAESVAGMVEALLKDPSLSDKDRKSLEALR